MSNSTVIGRRVYVPHLDLTGTVQAHADGIPTRVRLDADPGLLVEVGHLLVVTAELWPLVKQFVKSVISILRARGRRRRSIRPQVPGGTPAIVERWAYVRGLSGIPTPSVGIGSSPQGAVVVDNLKDANGVVYRTSSGSIRYAPLRYLSSVSDLPKRLPRSQVAEFESAA